MLKLLLNSLALTLLVTQSLLANEVSNNAELLKKEQIIEKVARDVESILISTTLKSTYESIDIDPIFGGGNAEKIYRELLIEEYAKNMANNQGFGLKSSIIKDIKRNDPDYLKLQGAKDE